MTIVLLPGDGREAARFRWSRGRTVVSILAIVLSLGLSATAGYKLGRAEQSRAEPAVGAAHVAKEPALPSAGGATPFVAEHVQVPKDSPEVVEPEREVESPRVPGPALLLALSATEQPVELHPLSLDGRPMAQDYEALRQAFACREGAPEALDPLLLQALIEVHAHFARPVELIGGRCAEHPEQYESGRHHQAGRAVDIRIRGVATGKLAGWLQEHGLGGVGRYKKEGFVHVDVRQGDPTTWESTGADNGETEQVHQGAGLSKRSSVEVPREDTHELEKPQTRAAQLAEADQPQAAVSTTASEP